LNSDVFTPRASPKGSCPLSACMESSILCSMGTEKKEMLGSFGASFYPHLKIVP
jgi:hypothetical protein